MIAVLYPRRQHLSIAVQDYKGIRGARYEEWALQYALAEYEDA